MKTTGKWLLAMALTAMATGAAYAEDGKAGNEVQAVKVSAWERVGDTNAVPQPAEVAKALAPGEEALRARKADMVRRMFWIMIAHR